MHAPSARASVPTPQPVPGRYRAAVSASDAPPPALATPGVRVETSGWPSCLPPHLRPVRVLGVGGTARVWLARDRRTGHHVAVKVVEWAAGPAGVSGAAVRLVRFEREARSLARLGGHPGVPEVLGLGVDPAGVAWMVSQYVVGPTIADRVLGGDPLDLAESIAVLWGVADALAAAHSHGVVHGDVSPGNVVLGSSGPVLVDFGVGGLDGTSGDRAVTPLVASPERLAGAGPSIADDVHALAASIRWATGPEASLPASIEDRLIACVDRSPGSRPSSADLAAAARTAAGSGWGPRMPRR